MIVLQTVEDVRMYTCALRHTVPRTAESMSISTSLPKRRSKDLVQGESELSLGQRSMLGSSARTIHMRKRNSSNFRCLSSYTAFRLRGVSMSSIYDTAVTHCNHWNRSFTIEILIATKRRPPKRNAWESGRHRQNHTRKLTNMGIESLAECAPKAQFECLFFTNIPSMLPKSF